MSVESISAKKTAKSPESGVGAFHWTKKSVAAQLEKAGLKYEQLPSGDLAASARTAKDVVALANSMTAEQLNDFVRHVLVAESSKCWFTVTPASEKALAWELGKRLPTTKDAVEAFFQHPAVRKDRPAAEAAAHALIRGAEDRPLE